MTNTAAFNGAFPAGTGASITFAVIAILLAGAVIGILAILAAGIRGDDRARTLTGAPRTRMAAVTRRLLGVGVRGGGTGSEDRR
jgi:hypothetical protein